MTLSTVVTASAVATYQYEKLKESISELQAQMTTDKADLQGQMAALQAQNDAILRGLQTKAEVKAVSNSTTPPT